MTWSPHPLPPDLELLKLLLGEELEGGALAAQLELVLFPESHFDEVREVHLRVRARESERAREASGVRDKGLGMRDAGLGVRG